MIAARDVVEALRKIFVMDERIGRLSEEVKFLAERYEDLDRRLARLEGKFELLESLGAPRRKRLPPA